MKTILNTLLTALACIVLLQSVLAASIVPFTFVCPNASGSGPNTLINYGQNIGGYGTETINSAPSGSNPYFTTSIRNTDNIPLNLIDGKYINAGANYYLNVVSCNYSSTNTFDPFTVQYTMTNGKSSFVTAATNNSITISRYEGLAK